MSFDQLDPVAGLLAYVNEIKPYHTKIVEVLVEYVHIDCVDVSIVEAIDFCFDLGMSGIDSRYAYSVIAVDLITNSITFQGSAGPTNQPTIQDGQTVQIIQSSSNDGRYVAVDVSYDIVTDQTTLTLQEPLSSAVVDGIITDNVTIYCDTANTPFVAPPRFITACDDRGFGSIYDGYAYTLQSNPTPNNLVVDGNIVDTIEIGQLVILHDDNNVVIASLVVTGALTVGSTTVITTLQTIPALLPVPHYITVRYIGYDSSLVTCYGSGIDPFDAHIGVVIGESLVFGDLGLVLTDNIDTDDWESVDSLQTNITTTALDDAAAVFGDMFSVDNELLEQSTHISTAPPEPTSTAFTEDLVFGWGNITEWFQYMIIGASTTSNVFDLLGNATADVQVGQVIRVLGTAHNFGTYTVVSLAFNGIYTEVTVSEPIQNDGAGGYVEPVDDLPISIILSDVIGIDVVEVAESYVLSASGSLVGSYDYGYWDVGGFDESLGTLVILYGV